MESLGLINLALILGCAVGGAALIMGFGWLIERQINASGSGKAAVLSPVFLFDGDVLADATLDAHRMVKDAPKHLSDREMVLNLFQDRFPTLDYIMTHLAPGGHETVTAADGADHKVTIEDIDGLTRLTLDGATSDERQSLGEGATQEGLLRELNFLRDLSDAAPQLMWTQDNNGRLTWANTAYMRLSDRQLGHQNDRSRSWPKDVLFPDLQPSDATTRASLIDADTQELLWFDITTQRLGRDTVYFAIDATDKVKIENSKAKAMQTSARLFANLTTGLAIFDQQRRLATFNPRLTDLTRLTPRFLMSRPTVEMFLDALRESRILPEPKNYASWKEQFSALESAARAGTYCENWELIDGQTFRVTGKPYDDKSFVFLFDDITAEVDLTRRFKTDIETGQGVIDIQKHGIAVFSANGTMVMSNVAYKKLWNSNHDASVTSHQLRGEIAIWQSHCGAAPSWTDLRSFIARTSGTKTWTDHAILEDGRHVLCEGEYINDNMTVLSFKVEGEQKIAPIIHKLSLPDPSLRSAKG